MVVLTTDDADATGAFGLLPDRGDAYLSFYLGNDLFAGNDENYTNGVRIAWISGSRDPAIRSSSVQYSEACAN